MKKVLLTVLFFATCTMAMAKKNLKDKIDFMQTHFDITWAIPEGFKAEEWYRGEKMYSTVAPPKGGSAAVNLYWMGAMSADRNCRLLYQSTMVLAGGAASGKASVFSSFVVHELYSAVNGESAWKKNEEMKPEWNKYLTIASGPEARTAYNADSVYMVDFPNVSERFATGYNHCIGFYMVNADHMPIIVMCLLNDAGYQQKDKYIQAVRQAVRFGDSKWAYNDKKASKAFDRIQSKDRKWVYSE